MPKHILSDGSIWAHPVSEAGTSITVHVADMRHGIRQADQQPQILLMQDFANHTSVLFQSFLKTSLRKSLHSNAVRVGAILESGTRKG